MIPDRFTSPDALEAAGLRAQRPFGLRSKSPVAFEGAQAGAPPADTPPRSEKPLLAWATKVCIVAALVGFGATHLISRAVEGGGLAAAWREARLPKAPGEPETTGSIGPAARGAALDPCQAPARRQGAR